MGWGLSYRLNVTELSQSPQALLSQRLPPGEQLGGGGGHVAPDVGLRTSACGCGSQPGSLVTELSPRKQGRARGTGPEEDRWASMYLSFLIYYMHILQNQHGKLNENYTGSQFKLFKVVT